MTNLAVLGADIGTTGCRAVIYRPDGSCLANQSLEYPLYTPHAAWAEQNPEHIFQSFCTVVNQAVKQSGLASAEIAGLCLSSVFHSLLPVDSSGNALYNLLIWADGRSQPYTEKIKAEYDAAAIYNRTGCPVHPMYALSKIMWFKYERPDIFARAAKYISIKEYILYRLTGKFLVDRSIASGCGLYNIFKLEWDRDLLGLLGIQEHQLSEVVSTTHREYSLQPDIAALLGLSPATAVIPGAGDGAMSTVGSGTVSPGQLTAMVGTSGAVRVISDKPVVDLQGRTWCYNMTDQYWMIGGAINNGGISLRWVRDQLLDSVAQEAEKLGLDAYDLLSGYAAQAPAGSDGLILLPLFTGERAPYWNANARGVLFGLNLKHDKRHITRATLEGVMYRMFSIFSALEEVAGKTNEIRVSGSFTRSRLWLQIMADVFGRVISLPGEPEGSAFGAAAMGMYAIGMLREIKDIGSLITVKERYYPDEINHQVYSRLYDIYQRVYRNLRQEFHDIAAVQRALAK